ncbi:damage-control phosphatase [Archaeoglobus sp.]
MRIHPICPSCLLNRAYMESTFVTDDEELIFKAVGVALKVLAERYFTRDINAHIATEMHRRVYEVLGVEDPYKEVKEKANRIAMESLPMIKAFVENQPDRFRASAIASIIANTFDYGVMGHDVRDEDFLTFFLTEFKKGLKIDDLDEVRKLCKGRVCYLTDNCGEIVIDTLFMKEIKKLCEKLTVVVRGKPIISDATLEDALAVGVDKIADEILTNGKGAIGIIEEELPPETLERLESADVIIAKGMANYESLSESRFKPIAFLLKAKCKPIATDLGVDVGDMVAVLRR